MKKSKRVRCHHRPVRQFFSEYLESRLLLTAYPVTTTADSGAGSLRQAILNANVHVGLDSITFNISGSGVHVITPMSTLPAVTDPVTIDGTTQTGYTGTPLIQIKGSSAGATADGLDITGGSTTINALIVSNFSGSGISMSNAKGGNTIKNCYVGTDPTGALAAGNAVNGIVISGGSSNNTISSNLISANATGVAVIGTNTTANTVSGNKIGTDLSGTKALGNGIGLYTGNAATATTISGNLISANGTAFQYPGVEILQGNSNVLVGNLIGTDVTGTKALGNGGVGVLIEGGSQSNQIGTNGDGVNDAAERNIISANGTGFDYAGVEMSDSNTTGNFVAGNYIGTDISGTKALGNGGEGVIIENLAQNDRIGVNGSDVDAAAERNVISANGHAGSYAGIVLSASIQDVVAGNYVGTDLTGLLPLGNAGVGVKLADHVVLVQIGTNGDGVGDALERNVIAANGLDGMYLGPSSGANIAGNYIGANANGSALGNGNNGIWIDNGASGSRVGVNPSDTDAAAEGNLIIANGRNGVLITDPTSGTAHSTGNAIRGNSIHNNGASYLGISLNNQLNVNTVDAFPQGPNDFINYPMLQSGTAGSSTVISGLYPTAGFTTYTLDFYANSAADSPFNGPGDRWIGSSTVTTQGGAAFFTAHLAATTAGEWITATGTDTTGNTSEFSAPMQLPAVQYQIGGAAWAPVGPEPILEVQANGPDVSGRVAVAAPDPTNQNIMYIAADGGGVWKTTDWLDPIPNWSPLTDSMPSDQFGNLSYTPLALAGSNSQIIYAEVSGPGGGILKSTDGGATWNELANSIFDEATFASLVIDPTNANNVYVSAWSGATGGGGVYKSINGGTSWTNVTASIHNGAAADLVMDPANPSILYVGLVGDTTSGGAHNGIYETINGGTSWALLNNGVISGAAVGATVRLAISPSSPSVVYATVFDPALGNAPGGMPHRYKTANGGTSWTALAALPNADEPRDSHVLLSVDPHNASIVYVNGSNTLYQSTNGGANWTLIYNEDPVSVSFDDAGAVIETGGRGIYRWTGGTAPFLNKQGDLQDTEFNTLTISSNDPQVLFGIAQDQLAGLKSTQSTIWNYLGGGHDVGRIVVDPSFQNIVYEYDPTNPSSFVWKSIDGGATWAAAGTGIPTTNAGYTLAYASQRAFEIDPRNSNVLLLGTDRIYMSTDAASSWSAISPVLSPGQFVSAVAISPSDPTTSYAATTDGKMFVTTDGSTWNEADSGLPQTSLGHVMDIQIDPADPQHAYVVCGTYLGGDSGADHVFVTINGGTSWTNITGNLPPEDAGQALAVDWRFAPPRPYLGTLRGLFVSDDSGTHWNTLSSGMPNTIVTDVELSSYYDFLAVGTYGRGAFEIRVPGGTSDVITPGYSGAITLVRDYDQQDIDWVQGGHAGQLPISDPAGLTIIGDAFNDSIVLDYSNGNPLPKTIHLNGTFTLNGLSGTNLLANTNLEIGASTVYIPYANAASDPLSAIRGYLQNGYSNGLWTGVPTATTGVITSAAAAANVNRTTGIGYADSGEGLVSLPANTIELKYTLYGDTGLTGSVGFTDFMRMTQHYTLNSGATWGEGDFNYDGSVNSADFNLLKPNYGQTLPAPAAPAITSPPTSGRPSRTPAIPPPAAALRGSEQSAAAALAATTVTDVVKHKTRAGKAVKRGH